MVVITGGTSGLGLRLAEILVAQPGMDVVVTGRSRGTAEAAARGVGARSAVLDLGSLASVRGFAAEVAALTGGRPLEALVCNAGIQVRSRSKTSDGFETTFGVNHIGHVALIEELLRATGPPRRLVLVTSGTHDPAQRTGMPDPLEQATARELAFPGEQPSRGDSAEREGRRRYATSKLANVRTAVELSRRLAGTTVVTAFDPGLMPGTGLARDAGTLQRTLWSTAARLLLLIPGVQTPRQSARQLAPLVTGDSAIATGTYVERGRPRQPSVAARDSKAQAALYEDTRALIADAYRRADS
jgi:NAD(P)-dependent dehydrogenase (short-subunit alcohol dehydrogenase family)